MKQKKRVVLIVQDSTEILVESATDLLNWKLQYLAKKKKQKTKAKFLVATGYNNNETDLVF